MTKNKSSNTKKKNKKNEGVETIEKDTGKDFSPNLGLAIFLIFIGVISLLVNIGMLKWLSLLVFFFRFWPVWIILAGIRLILGRSRTAKIVSAILSILVAFLLIGIVLVTENQGANDWFNKRFEVFNFGNVPYKKDFSFSAGTEVESDEIIVSEEDFSGVSKREVELNIGAAEFDVADNRQDDYLKFSGTYIPAWGVPEIETDKKDGDLEIDFKSNKDDWWASPTLFIPRPEDAPKYLFEIGREFLNTDLSVKLGAGDGRIILDELNVDNLNTDVGAGELSVELNNYSIPAGETKFKIGAGKVTLKVPSDVGLKVDYSVGAGDFTVDSQDEEDFSTGGLGKDGVYESSNYDDAELKMNVNVEIGAGEMNIERISD